MAAWLRSSGRFSLALKRVIDYIGYRPERFPAPFLPPPTIYFARTEVGRFPTENGSFLPVQSILASRAFPTAHGFPVVQTPYHSSTISHDRILGCILGGAIGDAMGGQYEGQSPPIALDDSAQWSLSDDTQLTLATCEAIAEVGRVNPEAIAGQMSSWFAEGRVTGVGASTFASLRSLTQGGHWALAGMRGEQAAGNGAAMRIAPLAFLLDPADRSDRRTIRDVCRITHHNEEAYVGALAVVAAVRSAWMGTWTGTPDLLDRLVPLLPDSRVRERLDEVRRLGPHVPLAEIAGRLGNSGYVVESIPLALRGAEEVQSLGFRGMLEQLISSGGDTDTIASMAGQIAGTVFGYKALPVLLVERLPEREVVSNIAVKFSQIVCSNV